MTRPLPCPSRRLGFRLAAAVALVPLVLGPQPARAEDLPAALVAAASQYGNAPNERQCASVTGLGQRLPVQGGPDFAVSVAPASGYGPATVGAYLGDGLPGQAPPPFVQALVEAGAAQAVELTWVARDKRPPLPRPTYPSVPSEFRGVMPSNLPPVQPFGMPGPGGTRGLAFLVTGPDRELFARPDQNVGFGVPVPPSLRGQTPGQDARPAGVWGGNRLCWTPVPDRVLEYGNPVDHGNGLVDVTAAVLFHPARVPAWISDPRVIEAVWPNMPPRQVLWLEFRNTGDGWRYAGPGTLVPPERTHILERH